MYIKYSALRGFTLLELTVVLLILALLTGMGVLATIGAIESAKVVATQRKMDAIEEAFTKFRLAYQRLPCPGDLTIGNTDTTFGYEAQRTFPLRDINSYLGDTFFNCGIGTPSANFNNGASIVAYSTGYPAVEGSVPVRTLGLPDDFAYDGWGRKFSYAVDSYMTIPQAFSKVAPNLNCNSLRVRDGGNYFRTDGALYVLLSHGPNGHGGFLNTTAPMNAGSTNADERRNCHCDSNANLAGGAAMDSKRYVLASDPVDATAYWYGLVFVQKDATGGLGNSDSFDDIVRYKTRWQMLGDDDREALSYRGPQFVAKTASGVQIFQYQCGRLVEGAIISSSDTSNMRMAFTPNNTHLFTYAADGTCHLYSISGTTVGTATAPMSTSCPNNGNVYDDGVATIPDFPVMALSKNGYLAIAITASPYLKTWKFSGSKFIPIATTAIQPTPTAASDLISMTDDGVYILLSNRSADNSTKVYTRLSGGTYAELAAAGAGSPVGAAQPVGLPTRAAAAAFSPDGQYLAVAEAASMAGTAAVKLWRVNTNYNTFTALSSITLPADVDVRTIKFSPDGKHLAIAAAKNLLMYGIKADDEFFQEKVTWRLNYSDDTTPVASNITEIVFHPSSRYAIIATAGSGAGGTYGFTGVIDYYEATAWGAYGHAHPITGVMSITTAQ